MTLREAKNIFEEITDLCYKIEDTGLNGILESMYVDFENAENVFEIIELVSDILFHIEDMGWNDEDVEVIKNEIQDLYNTLQDEAE